MTQRSCPQKLGYRTVAEETQLIAEEKWLIDALTKIKNQRNCLQIERLHLESMKARFKHTPDKVADETLHETLIPTAKQDVPDAIVSSRNSIAFEEPLYNEVACNDEQLNLAVSRPHFSQEGSQDFNMEEYEEEEDCDNVVIDMNMLMNGTLE